MLLPPCSWAPNPLNLFFLRTLSLRRQYHLKKCIRQNNMRRELRPSIHPPSQSNWISATIWRHPRKGYNVFRPSTTATNKKCQDSSSRGNGESEPFTKKKGLGLSLGLLSLPLSLSGEEVKAPLNWQKETGLENLFLRAEHCATGEERTHSLVLAISGI